MDTSIRSPDDNYDLDLGDSHLLRWTTYQGAEERHTGAILYHLNAKDPTVWCMSGIAWEVWSGDIGPIWILVGQADAQITVTPSIHCLACGDHGFIREGRWIKA